MQDQAIREATKWIPDRKKPLRRPRQRWIDSVRNDLQMLRITNDEDLANCRDVWRGVVIAAKGLNGQY